MNPVTRALKQMLGTAMESVEVFDYSIAEDFEKLWKFEGMSDRILIIWGGTAPDGKLWPIDASACLSPLDWASAYARHCFPEVAEKEKPPVEVRHWPQIMVLDADPTAHASVPTLAHFHTLRDDQLPWLSVPKNPSLKEVCKWLAATTIQVDKTTRDALTRFLREIRLNLTEVRTEGDYDRHSISNIVTPMVFLGRAAKPSPHADALLKLLEACELCSGQGYSDHPVKAAIGKDLSVLLVDDQAEHGWAQWLQTSLEPEHFAYRTDPNVLLDVLEEQFIMADKEADKGHKRAKVKDLRFRLRLPGIEEASNPVLFLDLRLFSGRAEAERKFLKDTLLPLIEERFLDRDNLAWPSFSTDSRAFVDARSAIQNVCLVPESPEHHEALTWLPRVLALTDPSLAIVVFSSTSLRSLMSPLVPFQNVSFFQGKQALVATRGGKIPNPGGELNQTISALRELVEQRRRLSDFMCRSEQCQGTSKSGDALLKSKSEITVSKAHLVAYLEETGSAPNLTFGTLIVAYKSKEEELEVDRALSKKYGKSIRAESGKSWLRRNLCDVASDLKEALSIPPLLLLLRGSPDRFYQNDLDYSDELHDENVADNLWRELLKQSVESSIYVLARSMLSGAAPKSFSVRAPTRVLPPKSNTLRYALWERWGISTDKVGRDAAISEAVSEVGRALGELGRAPNDWPDLISDALRELKERLEQEAGEEGGRDSRLEMLSGKLKEIGMRNKWSEMIRYFNFDGPRPMVEGIMKLYRDSRCSPIADVVRGFAVNAHGGAQASKIPVQHFIVDALLDSVKSGNCPIEVRMQDYGESLEQALVTNRLLASERIVEAVANQIGAVATSASASVHGAIIGELRGAIAQRLEGGDLVRLARYLAASEDLTVESQKAHSGSVFFKGHPGAEMAHVRAENGKVYFLMPDGMRLQDGERIHFTLQRDRIPGKGLVAKVTH